jgi:hypothetical protein
MKLSTATAVLLKCEQANVRDQSRPRAAWPEGWANLRHLQPPYHRPAYGLGLVNYSYESGSHPHDNPPHSISAIHTKFRTQ